MAKATSKTPGKKSVKKTAQTKTLKTPSIEKVCDEALRKLQVLGIDQQLQADIEWCLGSYRHDKNPAGLYEMASRVLAIYQTEKAKKTKGITTKMILDVEKVINNP